MIKVLKILFLCIIFALLSCSNSETENSENIIRVATPGKHPLFSYPNAEDKLEGYDIDIWEEIGRRLNRKIEWTQIAMQGAFGSLESGQADTVAQQISITPLRAENIIFQSHIF